MGTHPELLEENLLAPIDSGPSRYALARSSVDNARPPREPRRIVKTKLTLTPGANGTKKLVEQYGDRLVCVRYRYDEARRMRLKTVELIEEESPWTPAGAGAVYLVRIDYDETALRARVKEAGGRWSPQRKLWLLTRDTLRRLSLEDRIVAWLPQE